MTLDLRTRWDGDEPPVEPAAFFREELPALAEERLHRVAPAQPHLRLDPFCLEVDGEPHTLRAKEGRLTVEPGRGGRARARLTREQFVDLVLDQTTPVAFMSNAVLDMPEGRLPDFLNWWLVLRALLDDRPVHVPGAVRFEIPGHRSFELGDSEEAMGHFLADRGYLHLRRVFTEGEMRAVAADYARAAPRYRRGDPLAWFATTADGAEHLVRMEGFERFSPAAATLLEDPRLARIAEIAGPGYEPRRDRMYRAGALSKPLHVVKGISDLPWHKDCSLGRHSYECCALTVGISVTGADARSGQLRVVPGSHRALVWPAPCLQPGLDLAPLDLPTGTGDVTVHLSCTLHMSQPPVERTRKVLYTGFALEPRDPEAAARNRRRLQEVRSKTHTTVSQEPAVPPGAGTGRRPATVEHGPGGGPPPDEEDR